MACRGVRVDDRGVVERIADDGIFGREQRFENTAVGIEASGIEDGIVRFEEARDGCFEVPCGGSWVPQMKRTDDMP